jgi:site-specific recombinase XerD
MTLNKPIGLLDLATNELKRQGFTKQTQITYTMWIRKFITFAGSQLMHDDSLPAKYIERLAAAGRPIASQRQCISALRLFYRRVISRPFNCIGLQSEEIRPRDIELISRDEMKKMISAQDKDLSLVVLLIYGAGLKMVEIVNLRVESIHFKKQLISAIDENGSRRHVLLPFALVNRLKSKIEAAKQAFDKKRNGGAAGKPLTTVKKGKRVDCQKAWLFPGRDTEAIEGSNFLYWKHACPDTFTKAMAKSSRDTLGRKITPVVLRTSFAYSLFDQGCDKQAIMNAMGYKNPKSVLSLLRTFKSISQEHEPISPLDFYQRPKDNGFHG